MDVDGVRQRPVMLHRAIFGSLERFTALLTEHYEGAFPFWLCERQISILPIADRHNEYCQQLAEKLRDKGLRVGLDIRPEKINAKIRDAQLEQIPYMLIAGDAEINSEQVSVRERRKGDLGSMSVGEFLDLAISSS